MLPKCKGVRQDWANFQIAQNHHVLSCHSRWIRYVLHKLILRLYLRHGRNPHQSVYGKELFSGEFLHIIWSRSNRQRSITRLTMWALETYAIAGINLGSIIADVEMNL